ncbi:MAG: hypothetical protein EHM41_05680 [Chloroflexi bacterium]|nr:MAG: hypothetical protein EHM41_05680 [Chloroflexota bacterium]
MKILLALALVLAISLMAFSPASAHMAPPCNDSDGDGSPSGQEYAEHHIAALAQAGMLGSGGHVPGTHHGFSLCNPSGK